MASGSQSNSRLSLSEPRRVVAYRRTSSDQPEVSGLQEDRLNNWVSYEFCDWRPSPMFDTGRIKKGNQEKEREKGGDGEVATGLSRETSPGSQDQRCHTPATVPRTRGVSGAQHQALYNLRQQLSFSDNDEGGGDSERNNERYIPSRRDPPTLQSQDMAHNETGVRSPALPRNEMAACPGSEGASYRPSNLEKEGMPDGNQIVGRLMQIRDYIKQASAMMDRLSTSTDAEDRYRATQLEQVIARLKEQEQKYLELLLKLSTSCEEDLMAKKNSREGVNARPGDTESEATTELDVQSHTSEYTTDQNDTTPRPRIEDHLGCTLGADGEVTQSSITNGLSQPTAGSEEQLSLAAEMASRQTDLQMDLSKKTDELEALRLQHDLLKKMLMQKEQLRALQGRQAALTAIQQEAEERLADQGRINPNGGSREFGAVADLASDGLVPQEIQDLWQQLDSLKNIYSQEQSTSENHREEMSIATVEDVPIVTGEQNPLKIKLNELQQKKEQMDELLQELHAMRDHKYLTSRDQEATSSTSSCLRLVEGATASVSAATTASEAQQVLKAMETSKKLEKLQQVRSQLDQLRGLMQYYQSGREVTAANAIADTDNMSALPILSDYEDPQLMQNLREMRSGDTISSLLAQYTQDGCQADEQADKVEVDTQTQDGDLDDEEAQITEGLGPWADDPDIKLKVKRLKAAKEKLRRLQDLVGLVTQTPEIMDVLPAELAHLANSLDNHDNDGEDRQSLTSDTPHILQVQAAQQQQPGDQRQKKRSEHFYQECMDQQRAELQQLTNERQKLLAVQEELQRLHDELPVAMRNKNTTGGPQREHRQQQQMNQQRQLQQQQQSRSEVDDTHVKTGQQPQQHQVQQEQQVTFQEPLATVVPNDEVYNRMRQQRVLREELRDKKKVLENMMRKDTATRRQYQRNQDIQSDNVSYSNRSDTGGGASASEDVTMATWGGSTAGNLESIEEDENDQHEDQRQCDNGDDDGYPSDGIVQVEEEEEANVSDDRDTYTIENEFGGRHSVRRPHNSAPSGGIALRTRTRQQSAPLVTSTSGRDGPRYRYNYWAPDKNNLVNNTHSGHTHSARPRRRQENLLWAGEIPEPGFPSQLVEEIQELRQQVTALCSMQASRDNYSLLQPASQPPALALHSPAGIMPSMSNSTSHRLNGQLHWLNHVYTSLAHQQQDMMEKMLRLEGLMMGQEGSHCSSPGNSIPSHQPPFSLSAAMTKPFNLNPSFPDSFKASRPSPHSNESRLSASSLSHHQASFVCCPDENTSLNRRTVQSHQGIGYSPQGAAPSNLNHIQQDSTSPMETAHQPIPPNSPDAITIETVQASDTRRVVPKLNLEELLKSRRKVSLRKNKKIQSHRQHMEGVSGLRVTPRQEAVARLASQVEPGSWRPGLSAGISGTAYDAVSVSSIVSSTPGAEQPTNQTHPTATQTQHADQMRDASADLTMFEALRETIYAEVATLISQNESRPHYLIELFRELQMLGNDYLRQRALYAVQELVTRHLTEEDLCEQKGSDEQCQGNTSRRYDYTEPVENASSLSTSSSRASPFARDSLGDTVIHFDKAMQHMREYDRRLGEEPVQSEVPSRETAQQPMPTKSASCGGNTVSDIASSSAQDDASDGSLSDVTYPRINTGELDQQIKAIMREVIPVLKGHMGEVCSAALLAYVRRLVLMRARQQHPTGNQVRGEFTRFFHNQLAVILQDSLAKFEGRKMRECGEDLLVDLSEMLFNELAFFRLMQDLDASKAKVKAQLHGWQQTSTDTGAAQGQDGEPLAEQGEVKSHSSSSSSSSLHSSSSSLASQADSESESDNDKEENGEMDVSERDEISEHEATTADEEEDTLGKERDDDFAAQVEIVDKEDEGDSEALTNSSVKIELAPSETKPYTRIGSDEDDEGEDEVASAEDPSETAVSRDAEKERSAASSCIDMASSGGSGGESDCQQQIKANKEEKGGGKYGAEKERDESVTVEMQAPEEAGLNDSTNGEDELADRVAAETDTQDGLEVVLEYMQGSHELAGDPNALPTPDGQPMLDTARTP